MRHEKGALGRGIGGGAHAQGHCGGGYQRCDEASGKLKSLLLNHNILEGGAEGGRRREEGGESLKWRGKGTRIYTKASSGLFPAAPP